MTPNMRASSSVVAIIAQTERFRPTAYCATQAERAKNIWTAGYGHTHGVKEGDTCDTAQAIAWLHDDVHGAEDIINRDILVSLTQNQFDALVSFVFNCGEPQTMFRYINAGEFMLASAEFPRWDHQNGRVVEGLTIRRARERALFDKV